MAIRMKDGNIKANGRIKIGDSVRVSKLTLAQSKTEGNRTLQLNDPSSQVGDLAIFFNQVGGSITQGGYPSGWTGIATISNFTNVQFLISYKILTATDIDRDITGATGGGGAQVSAIVFRPDRPITNVSILDFQSENNHVCSIGNVGQTITLDKEGYSPVIAFISYVSRSSFIWNSNGNALCDTTMTFVPPIDATVRYAYNTFKIFNGGQISENITFDFCRIGPTLATILSYFYLQVD